MLCVSHVDVTEMVNNFAVDFFRDPLVEAAVSRFHVEDGNFAPFGRDDCQAGVGISQEQKRLGVLLGHYCIGLADDIPDGFGQRCPHCIQKMVDLSKSQVFEENFV
jgi:hypothetical protein